MASFTKEELISMGYDEETAELLAKPSGGSGGVSPFTKLSMNYSDILADEAGVKKGNFIAGWKEDKKTLSVKEEGKDLGVDLEMVFLAETYQVSFFDTATNSNIFQTPFFNSPFDTKDAKDKKTGVTVAEWKASGKKATFNQICLVLARPFGTTEWSPYLVYLHGTNYHRWRTQLEELGLEGEYKLRQKFRIKPVKIATDFQPAWCFSIVEHSERTPAETVGAIPVTSSAIKEFNKWIESSNSRGSSSTEVKRPAKVAEEDGNEDDIQF